MLGLTRQSHPGLWDMALNPRTSEKFLSDCVEFLGGEVRSCHREEMPVKFGHLGRMFTMAGVDAPLERF